MKALSGCNDLLVMVMEQLSWLLLEEYRYNVQNAWGGPQTLSSYVQGKKRSSAAERRIVGISARTPPEIVNIP